jgi:hypothetical protein
VIATRLFAASPRYEKRQALSEPASVVIFDHPINVGLMAHRDSRRGSGCLLARAHRLNIRHR